MEVGDTGGSRKQGRSKENRGEERIQGTRKGYMGHAKDTGYKRMIQGTREGYRGQGMIQGTREGYREQEKDTGAS